jgi:hypothetical protein
VLCVRDDRRPCASSSPPYAAAVDSARRSAAGSSSRLCVARSRDRLRGQARPDLHLTATSTTCEFDPPGVLVGGLSPACVAGLLGAFALFGPRHAAARLLAPLYPTLVIQYTSCHGAVAVVALVCRRWLALLAVPGQWCLPWQRLGCPRCRLGCDASGAPVASRAPACRYLMGGTWSRLAFGVFGQGLSLPTLLSLPSACSAARDYARAGPHPVGSIPPVRPST